jgi:hypothetical protein
MVVLKFSLLLFFPHYRTEIGIVINVANKIAKNKQTLFIYVVTEYLRNNGILGA